MNREVLTVRAEATLKELHALFRRYDVSVIPIVGRDADGRMRRLQGVATRGDLLKALLDSKSTRQLESRFARPVSSIARNAGALRPTESLTEAVQRITEAGIPSLPVVEMTPSGGRLVGIVSLADLLQRPGWHPTPV